MPWICASFVDLIASVHKHESNPNHKNTLSCAGNTFTNLEFFVKKAILKTTLKDDSKPNSFSNSFLKVPRSDSNPKHPSTRKELVF